MSKKEDLICELRNLSDGLLMHAEEVTNERSILRRFVDLKHELYELADLIENPHHLESR